jgi:hypothetical protein
MSHVPKDISEAHVAQIAPAILEMVSEDNQIIQNTLWKEVFFTLGKEFPEVWSMIGNSPLQERGRSIFEEGSGLQTVNRRIA